MQLVTVGKDFFSKCKKYGTDREMLYDKQGRHCVLIVDLVYKRQKRTFVVPLRSNIFKSVPRSQYFPLPPNASTQPRKRHGVHYIKLFPMDRKYVHPYKISQSAYLVTVKSILDKNESKIVIACQDYLSEYEKRQNSHKYLDCGSFFFSPKER